MDQPPHHFGHQPPHHPMHHPAHPIPGTPGLDGRLAPYGPPPQPSLPPRPRLQLTFEAAIWLLAGLVTCLIAGYHLTLATGVIGKPGTFTVEHIGATGSPNGDGARGSRYEGTFRSHDGTVHAPRVSIVSVPAVPDRTEARLVDERYIVFGPTNEQYFAVGWRSWLGSLGALSAGIGCIMLGIFVMRRAPAAHERHRRLTSRKMSPQEARILKLAGIAFCCLVAFGCAGQIPG